MEVKRCAQCAQSLPIEAFAPRAGRPAGNRHSFCGPCAKAYRARWYRANKTRMKELTARWRKKHPARWRALGRKNRNVAQSRARNRAWHMKNRDKVRARKKAYLLANAEKERARVRVWNKVMKQRRRRAVGVFTREQLEARLAFYGYRCAYCGGPFEHIDHVIPLSKGGSNWPANLRPACAHCNTRKGARRLSEWLAEP